MKMTLSNPSCIETSLISNEKDYPRRISHSVAAENLSRNHHLSRLELLGLSPFELPRIVSLLTGHPEASVTQKTFTAWDPLVVTSALVTERLFSLNMRVTSDRRPALSSQQSSSLIPCNVLQPSQEHHTCNVYLKLM